LRKKKNEKELENIGRELNSFMLQLKSEKIADSDLACHLDYFERNNVSVDNVIKIQLISSNGNLRSSQVMRDCDTRGIEKIKNDGMNSVD